MKKIIPIFLLFFIISNLFSQENNYIFNKDKINNIEEYDTFLSSDDLSKYENFYKDFYRKKNIKNVNAFLLKRYCNLSSEYAESKGYKNNIGYDFINSLKISENNYISNIICLISDKHDYLKICFDVKSEQAKIFYDEKKIYLNSGKQKINYAENHAGFVSFFVNKSNLNDYLNLFNSQNAIKYFFGKKSITISEEEQFFIQQYVLLFSQIDEIDKSRFSESEYKAIKENKIFTGMSEEALVVSWGFPEKINSSNYGNGTENQFCYKYQYVYTKNGKITGWN